MNAFEYNLDRRAFRQICELIIKHPWLASVSDALGMLWSLCDSEYEKSVFTQLFDKMRYLSNDDIDSLVSSVILEVDRLGFTGENAVLVAVGDAGESDGSSAFLYRFKNKVPFHKSWTGDSFIVDVKKLDSTKIQRKNIILFDDFLGTGGTFKGKFLTLQEQIPNLLQEAASVHFFALAGMEFGVAWLTRQLGLPIFVPLLLKKGISESFPQDEIDIAKKAMRRLEKLLSKTYGRDHRNNFRLGWHGSESLINFSGMNCPNNVFPIFWWASLDSGREFSTIFKRLPK